MWNAPCGATNAIGSEKVCGLSFEHVFLVHEDAAGVVQAIVEGAADDLELVRVHFDRMAFTMREWKPGVWIGSLLPAYTP
jgi:hypothetical protein